MIPTAGYVLLKTEKQLATGYGFEENFKTSISIRAVRFQKSSQSMPAYMSSESATVSPWQEQSGARFGTIEAGGKGGENYTVDT